MTAAASREQVGDRLCLCLPNHCKVGSAGDGLGELPVLSTRAAVAGRHLTRPAGPAGRRAEHRFKHDKRLSRVLENCRVLN